MDMPFSDRVNSNPLSPSFLTSFLPFSNISSSVSTCLPTTAWNSLKLGVMILAFLYLANESPFGSTITILLCLLANVIILFKKDSVNVPFK